MRKRLKLAVPVVMILTVVFTAQQCTSAAEDDGPDAQLAAMLPAEREFCEQTLWQIRPTSSDRDVLALLGKPSRDLVLKKNWWVQLGGRKDRVGVYFNASGFATAVVLDGGFGRFYYYRKVTDHTDTKPEHPRQGDGQERIEERK